VEVSLHFAGIYHLHLCGEKVSQARNQHEAGSRQALCVACFDPVDGLKMILQKKSVDFHQTTWHNTPEARTLDVVFYYDK
jgi:hypothetical protein